MSKVYFVSWWKLKKKMRLFFVYNFVYCLVACVFPQWRSVAPFSPQKWFKLFFVSKHAQNVLKCIKKCRLKIIFWLNKDFFGILRYFQIFRQKFVDYFFLLHMGWNVLGLPYLTIWRSFFPLEEAKFAFLFCLKRCEKNQFSDFFFACKNFLCRIY